jgi:hypothetical protein
MIAEQPAGSLLRVSFYITSQETVALGRVHHVNMYRHSNPSLHKNLIIWEVWGKSRHSPETRGWSRTRGQSAPKMYRYNSISLLGSMPRNCEKKMISSTKNSKDIRFGKQWRRNDIMSHVTLVDFVSAALFAIVSLSSLPPPSLPTIMPPYASRLVPDKMWQGFLWHLQGRCCWTYR